MRPTYYAGIGSRKTPPELVELMENLGTYLARKGHILRSGRAEGTDQAFERGCDIVGGLKEIYLPWRGFQGSDSCHYSLSKTAEDIAQKYHPNWDALSPAGKKLVTRDIYQVLGPEPFTQKTDFVVCYTPFGKVTGGTGQALRIAAAYSIPVFNMGDYEYEKNKFDRDVLIKDFNLFYTETKKNIQNEETEEYER